MALKSVLSATALFILPQEMHKNDDAFTMVGKTNTETHAVMNMALHPTVCLCDADHSRW
jgi:hypothetical protein